MKNIAKLSTAVLFGLASTMACAAQGVESTGGAFVTGGLGLSSYGAGGNQPFAIRVGGGYNFIKVLDGTLTIGAEGSIADFGKATWNTWFNSFSLHTRGLMVGGVVTWDVPHVEGLGVVGRVGFMNASTTYTVNGFSYSGSTTNPYFGAGAQYAFSKQLAVRAMYEDFGSAVTVTPGVSTNLTMLSANVVFNF